jgi:hypothetical protein
MNPAASKRSSTLKIEATCPPSTDYSRDVTKYITLHNHRSENAKSYICLFYMLRNVVYAFYLIHSSGLIFHHVKRSHGRLTTKLFQFL